MNENQTRSAASPKISTKNIVLVGMCTAILTIISQISIPMPTGVPITVQYFGITIIGVVFGWKIGLYSVITYILLGAVGLPVFSNFHGGLNWIFGITGGYILAWPVMVAACGIKFKHKNKTIQFVLTIVFSIAGLLFDEIAGGLQWAALSGDMTTRAVFAYAIVAFIPKDIFITVLAVIVGFQVRKPLAKLRLLDS